MLRSPKEQVKQEVKKIQEMETKLIVLQSSLSKNKEFQEFIRLQNAINSKAESVWSDVEQKMIKNDIKELDVDWVKLTIVQASKLEIKGILVPEFMKSVPDTKKINAYIKETGKAPKGVKQVPNPHLRKTFRQLVS